MALLPLLARPEGSLGVEGQRLLLVELVLVSEEAVSLVLEVLELAKVVTQLQQEVLEAFSE